MHARLNTNATQPHTTPSMARRPPSTTRSTEPSTAIARAHALVLLMMSPSSTRGVRLAARLCLILADVQAVVRK